MRFDSDRLFKQGGAGVDFNAKHPRQPKYSPDGIGGEFAPKDGPDAGAYVHALWSNLTPFVFGALSPKTARSELKAALRLLGKVAMSVGSFRQRELHALFDALNPALWKDVADGIEHVLAAKKFAGGKTLEEIIEHPGGPGFQEHHFLENTIENQRNLPAGYRDLPEQKGYIPSMAHEDVHAEMSRKNLQSGVGKVRDSFRNLSPERQKAKMFEIMRKRGILK